MSEDETNNPLISVIVPVYNSQEYLEQVIKSILNQKYHNLQIILVNDGSSDNSEKILNLFKREDSRIEVYYKKNGGVSSARNYGLKHAKGDFIIFIDSDDWIEPEMFAKMVNAANQYNVSIVGCSMRYVNKIGKKREIPYSYHMVGKKLDKDEAIIELIKELVYGGGSLCCRLVRKDLIVDERFIEGMRVSEDQEWLFRVIQRANAVMYIPESYYNIRVRENSATTKSLESDVRDINMLTENIKLWAKNNSMLDNVSVRNVIFVRNRLKYSSAIRAGLNTKRALSLKKDMKNSFKKAKHLPLSEIIKYYVALMPPKVYQLTRIYLKKIKGES